MDCAEVFTELLDYHFAAGSQEQRDAVREHMRGCMDCSQQYLDLKHDIDSGAALGERPSENTRSSLRREVASTFPPPRNAGLLNRTRSFLVQPTPRYRAFAAMAAAMALALGSALFFMQKPAERSPSGSEASAQLIPPEPLYRERPVYSGMPALGRHRAVDSARIQAVSVTYY